MIGPYLWRLPDVLYMRLTYEERQQVLEEFPKEIEINYQKYLESYEKPQPFYIGSPAGEYGRTASGVGYFL